jgi:hypothetical protein
MPQRPPTSIDGVVDEVIHAYVAWREKCTRVVSACAERLAALDGEDHAAAVYRTLVERTAASLRDETAVAPALRSAYCRRTVRAA